MRKHIQKYKHHYLVALVITCLLAAGGYFYSQGSLTVQGLRNAAQANGVDTDGDGIPDVDDNCPAVPNTNQADADRGTVQFTHENDSQSEDCIEEGVCLSRDTQGPVYNTGEDPIEWACGPCGEENSGYYSDLTDLAWRYEECGWEDLLNLPG